MLLEPLHLGIGRARGSEARQQFLVASGDFLERRLELVPRHPLALDDGEEARERLVGDPELVSDLLVLVERHAMNGGLLTDHVARDRPGHDLADLTSLVLDVDAGLCRWGAEPPGE